MSDLRDVYWLVTPLLVFGEDSKDLTKRSKAASRDNPKRYRSLTWALHWAIQVGDLIYETSATEGKRLDVKNFEKKSGRWKFFPKISARTIDSTKWTTLRDTLQLNVSRRKVGQTTKTPEQIEEYATRIWSGFGKQDYHPLVRNCQNFARLLYQTITLQPGEGDIPSSERATWEPMDEPVSHGLTTFSETVLKTGAGIGVTALYVGALADIAHQNGFDDRLLTGVNNVAGDLSNRAMAGLGAGGAVESDALGAEVAETTDGMGTETAVEAGSSEAAVPDMATNASTAVEVIGDPSDVAEMAGQASELVDGVQNAPGAVDVVQNASSGVVDAVQNAPGIADTVQDAADFVGATQNVSGITDAAGGASDILTNGMAATDAIGGGAGVEATKLGVAQAGHVATAAGIGGGATAGGTATAGSAAEGGAAANAASAAGTSSQTAAGAGKGAVGATKGAAGAGKGVAGTGKAATGAGKLKGFVAAGKGALASKGTAGAGATSGKVGLTAKTAAISHSAMHGAGAAKVGMVGASMVKVGPKMALAFPVAGVTIIATGAGLVYLTRQGRKDEKFNEEENQMRREESLRQFEDLKCRDQEHGGKDSKWLDKVQDLIRKSGSGGVSQFDSEDTLYGMPEKPNVVLEDAEVEALAKEVELSQVESAPDTIEELGWTEGAPSQTDARRSETV